MSEQQRRPRAALHQRSDSETNELPKSASVHSLSTSSNATSVSHKTNRVSPPHNTLFASTTTTDSTTRNDSSSAPTPTLRPSDSLDSLPPVVPLKIKKNRNSTFSVASDLPTATSRHAPWTLDDNRASSALSGTLVASSTASTPTYSKSQTFPRSILKNPTKPALGPYTPEEYRQKSTSWVGSSSAANAPHAPNRARMNARTLRLVRTEQELLEHPDAFYFPNRSSALSSRPSLRVSDGAGAGLPPHASSTFSSSGRPVTPPELSYAKQFPSWAKYFYGKKEGKDFSVIEPQPSPSTIASPTQQGIPLADRSQRHSDGSASTDSMAILEVILPEMAYHPRGPRKMTSTQSIPGRDWIGSRTKDSDTSSSIPWSLPHLDHTPVTRFENINRQVILFCLGFLLPFCWMIGAFLPLPGPKPVRQKSSTGDDSLNVDIEAQSSNLTREQERKYENARWWRKINRILSAVGLLIITAIVVLVIVATQLA